MILISAKPSNGFWRCGVFHPSEQTEHADEVFTPEQLEVLKAEPMLSVFITEGAPVVTDENPAGDENSPVGDENSPVGDENSPVGDENSPVGDNKKPKSKAE